MMRKFMMTSLLVFVRPGSAAQLAAGALVKMLKSLAMDTDQCSKLLKNAGYMLLNKIDHLIFCFSRSRSSSS
jgi:hypothetical protein